jgi:hypothetical protein
MLTKEEKEEILSLHREGCSRSEIAKKVGRSRNTVSKCIDGYASRTVSAVETHKAKTKTIVLQEPRTEDHVQGVIHAKQVFFEDINDPDNRYDLEWTCNWRFEESEKLEKRVSKLEEWLENNEEFIESLCEMQKCLFSQRCNECGAIVQLVQHCNNCGSNQCVRVRQIPTAGYIKDKAREYLGVNPRRH